jgi:hypothetical protein
MSRDETRLLCDTLAYEIVNRLRMSNETWDNYHGQPHPFSDSDYSEATVRISNILFKHTVWGNLQGEG